MIFAASSHWQDHNRYQNGQA